MLEFYEAPNDTRPSTDMYSKPDAARLAFFDPEDRDTHTKFYDIKQPDNYITKKTAGLSVGAVRDSVERKTYAQRVPKSLVEDYEKKEKDLQEKNDALERELIQIKTVVKQLREENAAFKEESTRVDKGLKRIIEEGAENGSDANEQKFIYVKIDDKKAQPAINSPSNAESEKNEAGSKEQESAPADGIEGETNEVVSEEQESATPRERTDGTEGPGGEEFSEKKDQLQSNLGTNKTVEASPPEGVSSAMMESIPWFM